MIKLKKVDRMTVTPAVKDLIQRIVVRKMNILRTELEERPQYKRVILKDYKGLLMSYKLYTENWDGVVGRLRSLPYTDIGIHAFYDAEYLAATTQPVIIDAKDENNQNVRYDLGPYLVFMPVEDLINNNINGMQFVPTRSPMAQQRTPHHYTNMRDGATSPLDGLPQTCWGGFNSVIKQLVQDFDLVELLRSIQVYLSRYNAASPLKLHYHIPVLDTLDWKVRVM